MPSAQEVLNQANVLLKQARDLETEHKGKSTYTADIQKQVDKILDDVEAKRAEHDALIEEEKRARRFTDMDSYLNQSSGRLPNMGGGGSDSPGDAFWKSAKLEERAAMKAFIRGDDFRKYDSSHRGRSDYGEEELKSRLFFGKYLKSGAGSLSDVELKALSATTDIEGGYLVPDTFRAELIQIRANLVFFRRLARVLPPITGGSVHVPAADTLMADATWTSELAIGAEETLQPFAQRTLTPHPMAKLIKVSNTLIRQSVIDVEGYVRAEMARAHGYAEENAFMTGNGNQQPLGVFNAASRGTDVVAAGTTGLLFDDVIEARYTLKSQYEPGASWIMHRTVAKSMAKLKDGDGQYIWQQAVIAGAPDTLFGFPVYRSEFAPSTMTTGLYVAALGDWGNAYWIVDSLNFSVQRLSELYAATNQTGFITREEADGMTVDGNGVVRVKLA